MNIFDIAQTGITIVLALISWFVPNCWWYIRVIVALTILLLSTMISWLRLYTKLRDLNKRLKNAEKERQDVETRHTALSVQFNEKVEKEQRFRRFISSMTLAFLIALEKTDKPKIENVYRVFLLEQERLDDRGVSDGRKN